MEIEKLSKADLAEFTGTEQWYRHQVAKNILYTDGIKYMAEKAGAYWLIDEIAFEQTNSIIKNEEFQVWTLIVNLEKSAAILACDDGDGWPVYTKQIGFTDFPLEEIKIYCTNNVILLPGEY